MGPMHPLRTTIDLDAIAANTRQLKAQAGPARLMCVVKADAYNHGIERCVPVMRAAGADAFGVATFAEARRVRELTDAPVLAWLWDIAQPIPEGIDVAAPSLAHVHSLIDAPLTPTVYLKVETGMHRAGIDEADWAEAFELANQAEQQGAIKVAGLMSHLAAADDPEDPYTDAQAKAFRRAIAMAREAGLDVECNHIANSAAALTRPDLHFDMVRAGVALYGLEPVAGREHGLAPAMTWTSSVLAVKRVEAGDTVSYGRTWAAPSDGWTAVVGAGYADGVQRGWQGALQVGIGGTHYPQVGRVCMDQIVVWLGENTGGVAAGDRAVLFGAGGVSATELADAAGTINYEVACTPKGRTVREYLFPVEGMRVCDGAVDTQELGRELGATLKAGDVVVLEGPLGAGKTTLTQGIAQGMGVKGRVTSPTFVIARQHRSLVGGPDLVHVDAYRLGDMAELDALDLDTELEDAVVVAEWGEGFVEQLAPGYIHVCINRDADERVITWRRGGM